MGKKTRVGKHEHKAGREKLVGSTLTAIALVIAMVVVLKLISVAFPDLAQQLSKLVEGYGLFGTFVAIFVGSSLLPFPTDAFFVSIVSLSANPLVILVIAIVASFLSGLVNYALASALSEAWVEKQLGKQLLGEAKHWFDSWGPWALVIFGTLPLSAIIDPLTFVAGLSKMNLGKFAVFSGISRILHFALLAFFALQAKGF